MEIVEIKEITITQGEYRQLVATEEKYRLLVKTIANNARKGWNDKYLCFDNEAISNVLRVISPGDYAFAEAMSKKDEE